MTLPEVIQALTDELPGKAVWRVAILNRRRLLVDPEQAEIREFPIVDVSVDHEDDEINLLTDENAPISVPPKDAITLEELFTRLQALDPRCSDYSVYSGSAWRSVGDGFEARHDVPLIGVARNHESCVFGFLQGPREQWDATT